MRITRFAVAVALALPPALAAQQQQGAAPPKSNINIPLQRYTLPNGLTVILSEDHATPMATVDVWYHVGSKNEVPGRTGFAHMFEHVMFTGSKNVPYGLHDRLTGGVGGDNNGGTENDRTGYYENVPGNYLESALWMEADRMGWLLDKLDESKFKAQRDIVQNERRQRTDNVPYGRAFEILTTATYPDSNPYSWPVVGYLTDLQSATVEDVKNFFRLYYAPSNATLAIVGDFDPKQARAWVAKYFGDIPRGKPIVRPKVAMPKLTSETHLVYEDRVQVPRLYVQWPSVPEPNGDDAALSMLGAVISGPRTARLTKALVYDKQLAASAFAGQNSREQSGEFISVMTPRPGHTLTELEAEMDSVIAKVKRDGVTPEELARAKAGQEFGFISGLESNLGKAEILASGNAYYNDPSHYKKQYAELTSVTPADIKRVANKYLTANRVVLSVVPMGKADMASKPEKSGKVTVSADGGHYTLEKK
ncbi:MAG: peptidase domain protein [Gemmatimonadetes bacterium]|nr:peptidase domain protein [Gemmatimonadota bacterium]